MGARQESSRDTLLWAGTRSCVGRGEGEEQGALLGQEMAVLGEKDGVSGCWVEKALRCADHWSMILQSSEQRRWR